MDAAEFDGQGGDLTTGFFEGPGTIDLFGGKAKLFLDRKLSGDAAARFVCTESAREEAFELLFGFAPGHDKTIEIFVDA